MESNSLVVLSWSMKRGHNRIAAEAVAGVVMVAAEAVEGREEVEVDAVVAAAGVTIETDSAENSLRLVGRCF